MSDVPPADFSRRRFFQQMAGTAALLAASDWRAWAAIKCDHEVLVIE